MLFNPLSNYYNCLETCSIETLEILYTKLSKFKIGHVNVYLFNITFFFHLMAVITKYYGIYLCFHLFKCCFSKPFENMNYEF